MTEKMTNSLAVAELTGIQTCVPRAKRQQRYLPVFTNRIAGTALNHRIGITNRYTNSIKTEEGK